MAKLSLTYKRSGAKYLPLALNSAADTWYPNLWSQSSERCVLLLKGLHNTSDYGIFKVGGFQREHKDHFIKNIGFIQSKLFIWLCSAICINFDNCMHF